jgi:hypothetical protein
MYFERKGDNLMAYFECPNPDCGEEREVEVELPKYVYGLEDPCEFCDYTLTSDQHDKLYMDLLADGWGSAVDDAMNRGER